MSLIPDGSVDITPSTSIPLSFQSGNVGGTVVSVSANNITILWDCATTACDAMTTLEHNGTEFFNPVIRIEGEDCPGGGSCVELPAYQRYAYSGNAINFYSNCGYCVTYDVSTSAGYFSNQQLYVSPPGTSVLYSGTIYNLYNVQYVLGSNCPKSPKSRNNAFVTKQMLTENALSNQVNDNIYVNSSTLQIYPNPVSDLVNIQLPDSSKGSSLTIYNSTGQAVHSRVIKNEGVSLQNVEVQDWVKGIYIIVLENNEFRQQSKFMVK